MSNDNRTTLTRRRFLAQGARAASLVALPYYVPASALGRGGAVAPSGRTVMGGIGLGGRGSYDLGYMLTEPDVQWVAVCDVQKGRREAAKNVVDSKYGNKDCAAYSDLRQLLAERTDVEAVLIATGDRWHALASILAMRAGKDVYCEKPACLTMAQGQAVVETARRYGRIYQTGAQRLSEPPHVFAIEMARTGRLGPIHTAYADCRWRDGLRHEWLPAQAEPSQEELDWDLWLGPSPWRPYNAGYVNGSGWYHYYDLATDVAMWGAHTVAQVLAGLDMTNVSSLEFEYAGPDATMVTRLSNGVKLVLFRVAGSVWDPCQYWHGACGERFDGPEGWAAAADGYTAPEVSAPALMRDYKKVLADYTARTQRPWNHVRDFLDCIRSRRPPVANPEVMCRSMNICLAADICEQLQRNLKFDLGPGRVRRRSRSQPAAVPRDARPVHDLTQPRRAREQIWADLRGLRGSAFKLTIRACQGRVGCAYGQTATDRVGRGLRRGAAVSAQWHKLARASEKRSVSAQRDGRDRRAAQKRSRLIVNLRADPRSSLVAPRIEGEPAFSSRIAGGINGDLATCAVTLNVVRSILEVGPGLKTMANLPVPSWFTAPP